MFATFVSLWHRQAGWEEFKWCWPCDDIYPVNRFTRRDMDKRIEEEGEYAICDASYLLLQSFGADTFKSCPNGSSTRPVYGALAIVPLDFRMEYHTALQQMAPKFMALDWAWISVKQYKERL